ncbi:KAP family P-loop NTPase fold protein [Mesorhizobium carmichaelinearum]|uniref:KAP family P-loop NTPase fold protein n=1 Tax=Mesorhizobium carmichaelinearum TaxID=1208188 RepID=UPI000BA4ADB7|nr:P-loop NTPase fold protein [Mesorhizobium carmichaelinearum]
MATKRASSGNDKIDSIRALQAWLGGETSEVAHVIALRIALRVLPTVGHILDESYPVTFDRGKLIILQSFRACFVSWVVGKYPARRMTTAAFAAAAAAGSDGPADIASSAINASAAAAGAAADMQSDDLGAARAAALNAARAAAQAAHSTPSPAGYDEVLSSSEIVATPDRDMWTSIDADREWLESNRGRRLVDQPLWLVDVRGAGHYQANMPIWARKPFDDIDKSDLVVRGPWLVWLQWYRAILPNSLNSSPQSLFGEKLDFEIATQPDSFWQGDADEVVGEIARMVGPRIPNIAGSAVENVRQKLESAGEIFADGARQLAEEAKQTKASETQRTKQAVAGTRPIVRRPGTRKKQSISSKSMPRENVRTLSDEPTARDRLGRRPFAQAVVERMDDVRAQGAPDGFAVHLHAPWGAGKTSILMMMEELMSAVARPVNRRWVVVSFNAWKNERRRPPWWPLIHQTFKCCRQSLWQDRSYWLWLSVTTRWLFWRIIADWFPLVVAALVMFLLVYFWWFSGNPQTEAMTGGWLGYLKQLAHGNMPWDANPPVLHESALDRLQDVVAGILGRVVALITALAAAFATFFAVGRAILFGSQDTAKFYSDLSADPLKRITDLFRSIVRHTGRPVAIFIDDLDRCNSDCVVELLEGIQTLFRGRDVAYVVAADRTWIKAAFEKRYDAFGADVGDAGQPLGYLFLEKIFQISTPIPGMNAPILETYWQELIEGESGLQGETVSAVQNETTRSDPASADNVAQREFDKRVATARVELRTESGGNVTSAKVENFLGKRGNSAEVRAAAALEINVSRAGDTEAKHLLGPFMNIVGEVPRVMKRMINAFAMRRAVGILEGSNVPQEALARWTILEQRWPALADLLIESPDRLDDLAVKLSSAKLSRLEPVWKPFANLVPLQMVIGRGPTALTAALVSVITHGSAGFSRPNNTASSARKSSLRSGSRAA